MTVGVILIPIFDSVEMIWYVHVYGYIILPQFLYTLSNAKTRKNRHLKYWLFDLSSSERGLKYETF